jgi:hypothetical protein
MKYPSPNTKTNIAIIPNIFPPLFCLYNCSGLAKEVSSIFPILNFGKIPLIAWLEWLASLNALVATHPALVWRTIGPPGC